MPPRRRPNETKALRDELARLIARSLTIAERFEALGLPGAGDRNRDRLSRLNAGEPVTIASWELGSALANIGAPAAVVRDVLGGRADFYDVDPEGSFEAANGAADAS